VVDLLLSRGAKIDSKDVDGYTSLMWAVENGNTEMAALLAKKGGASLKVESAGGQNLLGMAIAQGNMAMVAMLVSQGVDPNQPDRSGKTPLQMAIAKGQFKIARMLVEKGAVADPESARILQDNPDAKK
jgi:ankyrin repeat protein